LVAAFFDELADLTGDEGARVLIDRYPHMIKEVQVNDRGTLIDIDDPLGLERAMAFY
jgi:CTP:molybdopterin cytidylyltransferase MocA